MLMLRSRGGDAMTTTESDAEIRLRLRSRHALDALAAHQRQQQLIASDRAAAAGVRRDGSVGPTEQTVRHFRASVIVRLATSPLRWPDGSPVLDSHGEPRRRLDRSQVRAAQDIEAHFLAIGRGLWARASAYDVVSTHGSTLNDPAGRMTVDDLERMQDRYRPWVTAEGQIRVGNTTPVELVIDAVIDNLGCGQIGARHRLRHGRAYRVLFGSLARYCRIAGWAVPEPLPVHRATMEDQHGESSEGGGDDRRGPAQAQAPAAGRSSRPAAGGERCAHPDPRSAGGARHSGRIVDAYGGGIVRVG